MAATVVCVIQRTSLVGLCLSAKGVSGVGEAFGVLGNLNIAKGVGLSGGAGGLETLRIGFTSGSGLEHAKTNEVVIIPKPTSRTVSF